MDSSSPRDRFLWLCLIPLLSAVPRPARAMPQAMDTLRLVEALRIARQDNPALQAARASADAAAERIAPAGSLPDPSLTLALMNRPVGGFGTGEPMTMNQVGLSQAFPWPGKLGSRRRRAEHLARAERLDVDEAGQQLAERVAVVYYDLAYLDRALTVAGETRTLLRGFLEVAQSRYAAGQGLQQDLLQAQVAIARMSGDLLVMEQDRLAMAARFNALLGRDAATPVPAVELPEPGGVGPDPEALLAVALRRRPALAAAAERVEAARADHDAARRELYPDLMVSVTYGQRPRFDDMVSLMVGVSLPVWAGRRQAPLRRETAALTRGEEARQLDLRTETLALLTEARAEAERARELAELYRTAILPQAHAAVESALAAYRVGRVDFQTLIENEMTVNRYEMDAIRHRATWHQATARIGALLGPEEAGQ